MKLVWTPETASKAYIDTVKSIKNFKEHSGVAELLSAMAAGWNAKLIVESWLNGDPVVTSIGLAIAAHHACGRHVCIVPDERSKQGYIKAMREYADLSPPTPMEVVVGDAEAAMEGLVGVDFLVVDCKRGDFARVLRFAKLGQRGAVLACKNACQRNVSEFRWHGVLERGTRVVRTVFLPVGKGLDIAHIGSTGGSSGSWKKSPSRWIKHIDAQSGEEHVFRG
ncbi:hypothetical protein I3843_01G255000 [Carya illinoinensis]|uniref:Uncharacterized protein n=1 Tax=Carya illinoinensis TaxID=32201 RepID=A0A8T1RUI6_CARIL|nr:uncharacterized protein LOC122303566 [Carya illinoinensis]KAG2729647.1 hypothetical protein I3760_01G260200 [Carya illinoinensis]KAG6669711.1 hypothetical protein CIPAW_01G262700 [Carya illinoinensis]KAG6734252.1 hypothetical protein I3842_01G264500 [Carya illinoinensis]KAG7998355.1 hypothetical protein I3843_01G255000 [Carya illinoinensis]